MSAPRRNRTSVSASRSTSGSASGPASGSTSGSTSGPKKPSVAGRDGGSPRRPLATAAWTRALCVAALVLAAAHIYFMRFVCDDAFITFRYAANLAHGLGPVWNPGERVEGYTNFLWMIGAAKVIALGGRPEVAMPWASAGCALLTLVAIAWFLRRRGAIAACAIVLLAASSGFAAWATSGLETAAYTLFLTLGVLATAAALEPAEGTAAGPLARAGAALAPSPRALAAGALAFALAGLTRPEGVLGGGCAAVVVLAHAARGRIAWPRAAAWIAVWALPVAAHVAWRLSYYRHLLPNTATIKAPGLASVGAGAAYLLDALRYQYLALWLIPLAVLAWPRKDARRPQASTPRMPGTLAALIAAVVVPYLLYVCTTGGDFMPLHRFVAPLLPLLAIATGAGLGRIAGFAPARRIGALVAVAVVIAFTVLNVQLSRREQSSFTHGDLESIGLTRDNAANWHRVGARLRQLANPRDTLAASAAGIIPYESGLYTLDLLGLTSPDVSRLRLRETRRAGHAWYVRGSWLAEHPPQYLLGQPEVRPGIEHLGLDLDLEPEWRDRVFAHYVLMGMGLPSSRTRDNPGFVAIAVRQDVVSAFEAAARTRTR